MKRSLITATLVALALASGPAAASQPSFSLPNLTFAEGRTADGTVSSSSCTAAQIKAETCK